MGKKVRRGQRQPYDDGEDEILLPKCGQHNKQQKKKKLMNCKKEKALLLDVAQHTPYLFSPDVFWDTHAIECFLNVMGKPFTLLGTHSPAGCSRREGHDATINEQGTEIVGEMAMIKTRQEPFGDAEECQMDQKQKPTRKEEDVQKEVVDSCHPQLFDDFTLSLVVARALCFLARVVSSVHSKPPVDSTFLFPSFDTIEQASSYLKEKQKLFFTIRRGSEFISGANFIFGEYADVVTSSLLSCGEFQSTAIAKLLKVLERVYQGLVIIAKALDHASKAAAAGETNKGTNGKATFFSPRSCVIDKFQFALPLPASVIFFVELMVALKCPRKDFAGVAPLLLHRVRAAGEHVTFCETMVAIDKAFEYAATRHHASDEMKLAIAEEACDVVSRRIEGEAVHMRFIAFAEQLKNKQRASHGGLCQIGHRFHQLVSSLTAQDMKQAHATAKEQFRLAKQNQLDKEKSPRQEEQSEWAVSSDEDIEGVEASGSYYEVRPRMTNDRSKMNGVDSMGWHVPKGTKYMWRRAFHCPEPQRVEQDDHRKKKKKKHRAFLFPTTVIIKIENAATPREMSDLLMSCDKQCRDEVLLQSLRESFIFVMRNFLGNVSEPLWRRPKRDLEEYHRRVEEAFVSHRHHIIDAIGNMSAATQELPAAVMIDLLKGMQPSFVTYMVLLSYYEKHSKHIELWGDDSQLAALFETALLSTLGPHAEETVFAITWPPLGGVQNKGTAKPNSHLSVGGISGIFDIKKRALDAKIRDEKQLRWITVAKRYFDRLALLCSESQTDEEFRLHFTSLMGFIHAGYFDYFWESSWEKILQRAMNVLGTEFLCATPRDGPFNVELLLHRQGMPGFRKLPPSVIGRLQRVAGPQAIEHVLQSPSDDFVKWVNELAARPGITCCAQITCALCLQTAIDEDMKQVVEGLLALRAVAEALQEQATLLLHSHIALETSFPKAFAAFCSSLEGETVNHLHAQQFLASYAFAISAGASYGTLLGEMNKIYSEAKEARRAKKRVEKLTAKRIEKRDAKFETSALQGRKRQSEYKLVREQNFLCDQNVLDDTYSDNTDVEEEASASAQPIAAVAGRRQAVPIHCRLTGEVSEQEVDTEAASQLSILLERCYSKEKPGGSDGKEQVAQSGVLCTQKLFYHYDNIFANDRRDTAYYYDDEDPAEPSPGLVPLLYRVVCYAYPFQLLRWKLSFFRRLLFGKNESLYSSYSAPRPFSSEDYTANTDNWIFARMTTAMLLSAAFVPTQNCAALFANTDISRHVLNFLMGQLSREIGDAPPSATNGFSEGIVRDYMEAFAMLCEASNGVFTPTVILSSPPRKFAELLISQLHHHLLKMLSSSALENSSRRPIFDCAPSKFDFPLHLMRFMSNLFKVYNGEISPPISDYEHCTLPPAYSSMLCKPHFATKLAVLALQYEAMSRMRVKPDLYRNPAHPERAAYPKKMEKEAYRRARYLMDVRVPVLAEERGLEIPKKCDSTVFSICYLFDSFTGDCRHRRSRIDFDEIGGMLFHMKRRGEQALMEHLLALVRQRPQTLHGDGEEAGGAFLPREVCRIIGTFALNAIAEDSARMVYFTRAHSCN